jgi:hypothetical protein
MERVLLAALGGTRGRNSSRPGMPLSDLDARVLTLQINSIEKSTAKNYLTGARDYISFCTKHNLPLDPTPTTLCRYIAYTTQFISSAPKYLSGARHFLCDLYPQFNANRSHPLVQATIAGARKMRADPIRRKLPLRVAHLVAFLEHSHISGTYDDLLFATMISCAFYGCHRMGELVWKNDKSLHDWRKVIKRASLFFIDGRAQYHLPYHKSDRFYTGTDILLTPQPKADPVSLLREFIVKRDSLHNAKSALFLTEDGSVPSRAWFDSKFFKLLDRSFGGHSARAGGATFYASLGLSEDVIQALGRWSSQAWKIYIRDNPTIRAEIELARTRTHHPL